MYMYIYICIHMSLKFPKIGRTFLGVPIIRIIIYWGLYRVPYSRNLPYTVPSKSNKDSCALGVGSLEATIVSSFDHILFNKKIPEPDSH